MLCLIKLLLSFVEAYVTYGFYYQFFQIVILVKIHEVLTWQESVTGRNRKFACVD